MKALLRKIRQILRDRRTRRFLTRFVSGIAAIVVFVTTYALVLPAITMETQAACGIEAHQHDDSCYTENLICGQEESEGHHHTDDCYTVTRELECNLEEHQHSSENGCFDEEGNLVCKLEEHTHSDSCYKEHRELTCGLEESEGHHHSSECYEKVLTCGKEVHTHSTACYKADLQIESAAVASTGMTSAAAVPELFEEGSYSDNTENSEDDALVSKSLDEAENTDGDDKITSEDNSEDETEADIEDENADRDEIKDESDDVDKDDKKDKDNNEEEEEAASSFSTGFAADEDAANGDAYIPEKDALNFSTVLNGRTGIYFHHMTEDEEIVDSSSITDWDKADENTKLNPEDLIRVYMSYTLPKDTINATNDISRYRLPDALHLTDEQIEAINSCENGISAQYIDYDNLEVTDAERHTTYLGLESVEGTRRPGEQLKEDSQEYISAVVRAEKIYDEETDEYEGTDLIFTFSPYAVEKNAHAYDKKGQPTRAGEEVTGWLTLDFNMGQIEWAEDNTSEIVFAEEDQENDISEISTVLRQADPADAEADDSAVDGATEAADEYATEEAAEAATAAEIAAENSTEEAAAAATASETAAESSSETTDAKNDSDNEKDNNEESAAASYPAAVFEDSITVNSGRLDTDLEDTALPKKTRMTVHVEADEGTFPEGTKMVLSSVEDLDAVAEAVGSAVDEKKTRGFQAVDITFYDKDPSVEDAKEIEPLKPIRVSIKSDEIRKAAEDSSTAPVVVHVKESTSDDAAEINSSKTGVSEGSRIGADIGSQDDENDSLTFEADSFSVYAVVYTVDFKWEVDGKMYEFSLAGGDSVSFRELVEMLHVIDGDVTEFINDIADISFSDESLVKVAQITEGITAGGLKEKYGLKCEYSAELTENQREAMDSKVFYPVDWALISLKAFESEEYLTVELKTGEKFTINVTDAQIKKDYITASGETYTITVTYGEEAGIPDDVDLEVREIEAGSTEYVDYLQKSALQMNLTSDDLSFARFFDIAIVDENGEKIEPKAPVQVAIAYKETVEIDENQSLEIIHFGENGTEIIRDTSVSEDGKEIIYEQSSFSVTGTIVGTPNAGDQRMILVKDGNRYYIVNNDASLTEVGYENRTVSVIEPMLWTFEGSGNNRHIYFNSEATGFGTNQVASDYYRRYLDPTASTDTHNGYTEENKDVSVSLGDYNPAQWWNQDTGTYVSNNYVSNRNNALSETALTYDEGSNAIHQGNTYFTIERDADGKPVRLVGQDGSAGAAYFEFATASKLPNGFHLDNAVNHIDISIQGSAKVDIPLAYGSYYGPNGAASPAIKVVVDNEKLELNEAQMVDPSQLGITADDMKRATISASSPSNPDLDDAFYITGFSQNTGTAYSTPQVRIEGKFLVADVPEDQKYNGRHSLRNVEGSLYDGQGWWGYGRDWNYVNAVRAARLANKVTYTVTVIKPLQYYLTDPELGQLYDSEGNPIIVTVDVAFSASFNYWDDENSANGGNECPPIQGNADWRAGDIPNHDLSGMDFKLGGDADDPNSPLLAIEITKIIQDENGNRIALKTPVTNTFEIHKSTTAKRNGVKDIDVEEYKEQISEDMYQGYSPLHNKTITVGEQGMALVYDYNVSDGMYYIVEKSDPDNLPRTVTDTNDNVWDYVDTYIETEYVRRGDQYDDKDEYPNPMHVSKKFTTDDSEYKSVPEVLGKFTTLTGEEKKSGFLEFFVYNIYKPKKTELTFNKVWADALTDESGKYIIIGGTRYNLSNLRIEVELQRYSNNNTTPDDWTSVNDPLPENVRKQTLDGTADSVPPGTDAMGYETADWSCIWKNLPSSSGGNVYTYSAKEVSVKTADGTELTDKFLQITDKTGSNGVTVTNTLNNTNVTLEKQWDPVPDGNWSATFQIQRSRRQITDAQGNSVTNQPWSDWEQARTEAGAGGTDVPNQTIDQDTTDAKVTIENLPKYFKDTDGTIWEYKYRGLETDFQTISQETYDRSISQEGDAAHGYNIIATNKLSGITNVIAKKRWQSSADSSNNNGSGSGNSSSGSNNEDSIIADPNVIAIEFTLYELITDNNRPEGSVKIGGKWYKVATDADGHEVSKQKVLRGDSDKWTGEEQAAWTNLSRDKTYYVMETGTYYKNGGGEVYLDSAPNYASGGEVTLENGQRTATIFNKPLTLQLSKKWSGLVTGEEWPEGYTVEYTITREYSYKNGTNTISGTDDGFSFVVTKDNENAQYLLSSAQKTVDFTGIFPAYGVKDGNVAAYTYFVTETKVNTPDDTSYTFKTGERKVFLQDGSAVGLLKADINNQLTSVSVQKRWSGNHANDQATVTLYKYVDAGQSVTKVITVKVAEDNEVVDGQPTGKSKENLGDRIVYVVMDGDEATKQNLTKDGEVTFSVADDAEHYFTYSLSDTDDGRLTVTGPGHAHAGEAIKVAVQDNTQYLKTITVNLTFTNNNPDQDKFTSSDYIDVQINGQTKRLTRDNRTTSFQVLGAGTFPVSYTTSRPDYLGVIDADTNSLAQNRVVVGNDGAVINLKPVESQPTKIGFQGADLHKWTDNDYVTVVIDDGDNGSFTFKKGDSGTVRSLNLGNSGTHTLSYICGGDAVVTNGPTSIEATHEVTIYATSIPGANAKKVPITFTVSEDASLTNVGNWSVELSQFYAVEDQNNSNYKLSDGNKYLSPSNRSISSTNVPNTLSYKVNTRLNNQTQPPISLDFTVNGVGCTAIKNNDSITITNITSDTPTVQIHVRNLSRARNNTDLKQATSFFAHLLGAPIEVYAAGTTRTSFSDGNGLTVMGDTDLPQGAVAIDDYTGTGNEWSHTWKDLPVVDENGRTIHYYVVETGAATTGHYEEVQASHTVEINADGSYSVVIENTTTGEEPQTGAIQITKAVTVNDAVPTDSNKAKTNGTYEFTVAGITDTATAGISHTVRITFADGKATKYQIDTNVEETVTGTDNTWSVVLGDLPAGQYTVTETAPVNGMVLKTVTGTSVNEGTKVATVTVTAGEETPSQAAQVSFINNYTEYEVIIVKEDTTAPSTKLNGAVFDLYEESQVNQDGTLKPNAVVKTSGLTTDGTGDEKGKVSLGMLTTGKYYLFETTAPEGYNQLTEPIEVIIADGTVSLKQWGSIRTGTITQGKTELVVYNNPGVELPSTGGPGTHLIYLLGSALAIFAAALLGIRRTRHGR